MLYSIAVTVPLAASLESEITAEFDDGALDEMWSDLSVTDDRWKHWRLSNGAVALIPDFPVLSRLVYLDEGEVNFTPEPLRSECAQLVSLVFSPLATSLVVALEQAAVQASMGEGTVEVFVNSGGATVGCRWRVEVPLQRPRGLSADEIAFIEQEAQRLTRSDEDVRKLTEYLERARADLEQCDD